MPRSSSSRERSSIRSGVGPSSPVMATMTSVPPAIGRAGAAARRSYASNRLRGVSIAGSAGIRTGARSLGRGSDGGDRVDDLRVARAAAQVAGDALADAVLVAVAARVEV